MGNGQSDKYLRFMLEKKFLETIAEFYYFSAFVFGCITIIIEIENTPFLLHMTKMSSKTNTRQQVINLCQSWELRLEIK